MDRTEYHTEEVKESTLLSESREILHGLGQLEALLNEHFGGDEEEEKGEYAPTYSNILREIRDNLIESRDKIGDITRRLAEDVLPIIG